METTTGISSNVWSMSGLIISYTAGLLVLDNGNVSFTTAKGEQFRVPLSAIKNIKWPALQMGFGVHMEVNGKKYKLTFHEPRSNNAVAPGEYAGMSNIDDMAHRISHMKDYKAAAKEWKAVLGA